MFPHRGPWALHALLCLDEQENPVRGCGGQGGLSGEQPERSAGTAPRRTPCQPLGGAEACPRLLEQARGTSARRSPPTFPGRVPWWGGGSTAPCSPESCCTHTSTGCALGSEAAPPLRLEVVFLTGGARSPVPPRNPQFCKELKSLMKRKRLSGARLSKLAN